MVVQVQRIPAFAVEGLLPGREILPQGWQGKLFEIPFAVFPAVQIHVLKGEDHAELSALGRGEIHGIRRSCPGALAHGEQIAAGQDFPVHFLKIIMQARSHEIVIFACSAVIKLLGDQIDDIHPEPVHALVQPEFHQIIDFTAHRFIVPVEIRLLF